MEFRTQSLGSFGVEIRGVEPDREWPDEEVHALRALLLQEELVVLRGRPISPDRQCRLGEQLGPIESLSLDRSARTAGPLVVSNVGDDGRTLPDDHPRMQTLAINERWHTDSSFRETPASFSLLAPVEIPPQGGDTFFASLRRGWESLSRQSQGELLGLRAVHDYSAMGLPTIAHPIVRVHPETGRLGLYLSEHAPLIEGWPEARGRAQVEKLIRWCTHASRVHRHRWQEGDLLLWDNRSCLHRAEGFDSRFPRTMHHVRIAGTEPVTGANRLPEVSANT